jgi:hypothetical protein
MWQPNALYERVLHQSKYRLAELVLEAWLRADVIRYNFTYIDVRALLTPTFPNSA